MTGRFRACKIQTRRHAGQPYRKPKVFTNQAIPVAETLRFPRGVRFARKDEIPRCTDEILERIANARITTGFTTSASRDNGYSAYVEANIHADELWTAFETLAHSLLPPVAAPIIGFKGSEPTLGPYTDKSAALSALRPHRDLLQHDGFIEFGLIFQLHGHTEEIFVESSKYMQIWTNQREIAETTLIAMRVPPVDLLHFLDEFPHVTERLPDDPNTDETIADIVRSFADLPARPFPAAGLPSDPKLS